MTSMGKHIMINNKILPYNLIDETTGLYTKIAFLLGLEKLLENIDILTVMYLDLNEFKNINIVFGHDNGDIILKEVAKRILHFEFDIEARIDSDEFLIACIGNDENAANLLLNKIKEPIILNGKEIQISASIGVVFYNESYKNSAGALIDNAEIAMFHSKKNKSSSIVIYNNELGIKAIRHAKIIDALHNSVSQNALTLLYQPEIDLRTGKVVALEALMRLNDAEMGVISPTEFIPIAESTGAILQLGQWAIENICLFINKLTTLGLEFGVVSVNVSPIQMNRKEFVSEFMNTLKLHEIKTSTIQVEITESSLFEQIDSIIDKLIELKLQGITVALDDFGSTYSTLNYLVKLAVDIIKVDKTFIDDLINNSKKQVILKAIIDLSHLLGYRVVAEGIEDRYTERFLKSNDCDAIQGYLISPPISEAEIIEFLIKNQ